MSVQAGKRRISTIWAFVRRSDACKKITRTEPLFVGSCEQDHWRDNLENCKTGCITLKLPANFYASRSRNLPRADSLLCGVRDSFRERDDRSAEGKFSLTLPWSTSKRSAPRQGLRGLLCRLRHRFRDRDDDRCVWRERLSSTLIHSISRRLAPRPAPWKTSIL